MRKSIARRARNQKAPYHCIAAVEASCRMPFDEGCRREAELFTELENSDEARALRYAFFIEREVTRLPDIPANTPVRDFANAAVVGAGTMGGGIAMSFADFGFPVKIMDATPEALDRGMQRIRDNYATSVRRGSLAEDEMQRRLARIEPVAGLRGHRRLRRGDRGGVRGDGRQEAGVRQAGRGDEAWRAAVLQHLGARHRSARRR